MTCGFYDLYFLKYLTLFIKIFSLEIHWELCDFCLNIILFNIFFKHLLSFCFHLLLSAFRKSSASFSFNNLVSWENLEYALIIFTKKAISLDINELTVK